jgi:uncharacterized protein
MQLWYRRSAGQGDIASAYSLGQLYLDGSLTGKPDAVAAMPWFLMAAKGGDTSATYKVGMLYECGEGITHDDAKAAIWYRVAAERGWKPAQLRLGTLYESGHGVPQNKTQAAIWYRKASNKEGDAAFRYASLIQEKGETGKADARRFYRHAAVLYKLDAVQGDSDASQKLARMYESGTGVSPSNPNAFFWYSIAQEQGRSVISDLERVKAKLSPNQIRDIQLRVDKWINEF